MRDTVGLFLPTQWTLAECLTAVRYADARGLDSVWQSEVAFTRDPFVTMALYAGATRRIRLGAGVVHQPARSMAALCAALMTLDDAAPKRVQVALGPWNDQEAMRAGLLRSKPLLAMRETIEALRQLLRLEPLSVLGETLQLSEAWVRPVERPEPRTVPCLVGGSGAFHALAGEIADGVMLNSMVSPAYTAFAVQEARIGLDKARRDASQFVVAQLILCSVQQERDSEEAAFQRARRAVLQAVLQRPDWMRANGFSVELIAECHHLSGRGAPSEAIYRLLAPALVQQVVAFGSAQQVRARVREYVQAGATLPVLVPLTSDVRLLVDTFAQGYAYDTSFTPREGSL